MEEVLLTARLVQVDIFVRSTQLTEVSLALRATTAQEEELSSILALLEPMVLLARTKRI
jgi:hypothetical protein